MAPVLDYRSDTVTKPTAAMREAMAAAEVGDDVMRDDPSVNELEARVACLLGKEAGLYVPSGTMSNLIAICIWCERRGSEFICGDQAHVYYYEAGGAATVGGCHPRVVPNGADGTLCLAKVAECVRPLDDHFPATTCLCLENTQNKTGGKVLPLAYMDAAAALCKEKGIGLHVDGARLLNAAAKLALEPAELVRGADSVSLCLSKGVGAPVGSVLVGPAEFIARARRWRKALGGGMRQAGVLAAPALLALSDWRERLQADHAVALKLAEVLARFPEVAVRPPESNLVFVDLRAGVSPEAVREALKARGVLVLAVGGQALRFCTHHQCGGLEGVAALEPVLAEVLAAAR